MFAAIQAIGLALAGWRTHVRGDWRDRNGFYLILLYAALSYLTWWQFPQPVYIFAPMHVFFATIFLIYSTKMWGRIIGGCFWILIWADALVILGLLPQFHTPGGLFQWAYPDIKGLVSFIMLFGAWKGAGDARIDRPVLPDPFGGSRMGSGFLRLAKMEPKTPDKRPDRHPTDREKNPQAGKA